MKKGFDRRGPQFAAKPILINLWNLWNLWLIATEKGLDVGLFEEAPVAFGEVAEGEAADAGAVDGGDVVAGGGEHAADLVVAALGQHQPGAARPERLEHGRGQ